MNQARPATATSTPRGGLRRSKEARQLCCGVVSVFALAAAFAANPAVGQSISTREVKNSEWDTTYVAANGQRIRAKLVLDGSSGYYVTSFGRGRLRNIRYNFDTGGGGRDWAGSIRGDWSMGGQGGSFSLLARSDLRPVQFEGDWDFGDGSGSGGTWNGRFVRLLQNSDDDGNSGGGSGGSVTYGPWKYNSGKGYYYRKCSFPAGGYQYLVYYKNIKPDWVYWYNPSKQVFWCACPTSKNSRWGDDIRRGKDLFLMADTKADSLEDTVFPDAGSDGANFTPGKTKDRDGSTVDLGCPPDDLP
ncbi:MAG: hypothetical protein RIC55_06160 [Pirellulaceae bacterium]